MNLFYTGYEAGHSLYNWQPSRRNELDGISTAEVEAEKQEALEEIRPFKKRLSGFNREGNSPFAELARILDYYELYAEGFLLTAGIFFTARDIGRGRRWMNPISPSGLPGWNPTGCACSISSAAPGTRISCSC